MWAPLFAEWTDKDWIYTLLAGFGTVLTALSYALVRVMRQRGLNDAQSGDQQEKSGSRTFGEMKSLLADMTARLKELGLEVTAANARTDKVRENSDKKYEALHARVTNCESDRAGLRARVSSQAEWIEWTERILRKHGLLSGERQPTPGGGIPIPETPKGESP